MIERERRRERIWRKQPDTLRIVRGDRGTRGTSDIHSGYGLSARIAIRARVDPKQRDEFDLQADLLSRFSNGSAFHAFSEINEAAGNGPAERKILSIDQNDAIADLDNYVGGHRRCLRSRHDVKVTQTILAHTRTTPCSDG